MARRRGITLETTSESLISRSDPLESRSTDHLGRLSQEQGGDHSEPVHGKKLEIPVEDPDKPSLSFKRPPKGIVRFFKYLPGRVRNFWRILRPKMTPDELEAEQYKREERVKDRICKREGKIYGKKVAVALRQISNSVQNEVAYFGLVRWKMITRDESFTKIILVMDVQHVPPGILVSRLGRDPRYTDDLAADFGLPVHWQVGLWGVNLIIFRPVEENPEKKKISVEDLINDESIYG
jgi:hypothetical protein